MLRRFIDADMASTGQDLEAVRAEYAKSNPQNQLVQPSEVAELAAFLAGQPVIDRQRLRVSGHDGPIGHQVVDRCLPCRDLAQQEARGCGHVCHGKGQALRHMPCPQGTPV